MFPKSNQNIHFKFCSKSQILDPANECDIIGQRLSNVIPRKQSANSLKSLIHYPLKIIVTVV